MRLAFLTIVIAACGGTSTNGVDGGITVTCTFASVDLCTTATSTKHTEATLDEDCVGAGGAIAPSCATTKLVGICSGISSSDGVETIDLYSPTYDASAAATYCAGTTGSFSTP